MLLLLSIISTCLRYCGAATCAKVKQSLTYKEDEKNSYHLVEMMGVFLSEETNTKDDTMKILTSKKSKVNIDITLLKLYYINSSCLYLLTRRHHGQRSKTGDALPSCSL